MNYKTNATNNGILLTFQGHSPCQRTLEDKGKASRHEIPRITDEFKNILIKES